MDFHSNPVFSGAMGLLVGDLLGAGVNRVAKVITERANFLDNMGLKGNNDLLYRVLTLGLHAGLLALGTEFAVSAMPWLEEVPSGFVCFTLGMLFTNDVLKENMFAVNRALWLPSIAPTQTEPAPAS
jgi:hypothetical protein